jgi:hypothetical protein
LRQRCNHDPKLRAAVRTACRHDTLFFFNVFGWLKEPRARRYKGRVLPKMIPFITRPAQDVAIRTIHETLHRDGGGDVGVEKSRDEGATFIAIWLAIQDFTFERMVQIGMVSATFDKVWKSDDPGSLFKKVLWGLETLPPWMIGLREIDWRFRIKDAMFSHLPNQSTISGHAAVGDLGSGDRTTWFLLDELAKFPRGPDELALDSVRSVTDSRLIVSTPLGSSGAYFKVMNEPSNMVKVVLDWKDNPAKNRGLYRIVDDRPQALDPVDNPLPEAYQNLNKEVQEMYARLRRGGFNLHGGIRSPWYDRECDRPNATPESIARDIDHNFGASMERYFGDETLSKMGETTIAPRHRGHVLYNRDTLQGTWEESRSGDWRLWCELDNNQKPPPGSYLVTCDAAQGRGTVWSSNSVLEVLNLATGEQVAEFAVNNVTQADLADQMIACAKFFHGAMLAWESNNAGGLTNRIMQRNYPRFLTRPALFRKGKPYKSGGRMAGLFVDPETKRALFSELHVGIMESRLIIRSFEFKEEASQYVRNEDKIEHINARNDPTHGDRVMALGVGWLMGNHEHLFRQQPMGKQEHDPDNPPPRSLAALLLLKKMRDRQVPEDEWDEVVSGSSVQTVELGW